MFTITIQLEENNSAVHMTIKSGEKDECEKATMREYILGKMIAEVAGHIAPVLASAAEEVELARIAKPLLDSFRNTTVKVTGLTPKELIEASRDVRNRGEDIGEWLHNLAKSKAESDARDEHPAEPADETVSNDKPEGPAESEGPADA